MFCGENITRKNGQDTKLHQAHHFSCVKPLKDSFSFSTLNHTHRSNNNNNSNISSYNNGNNNNFSSYKNRNKSNKDNNDNKHSHVGMAGHEGDTISAYKDKRDERDDDLCVSKACNDKNLALDYSLRVLKHDNDDCSYNGKDAFRNGKCNLKDIINKSEEIKRWNKKRGVERWQECNGASEFKRITPFVSSTHEGK